MHDFAQDSDDKKISDRADGLFKTHKIPNFTKLSPKTTTMEYYGLHNKLQATAGAGDDLAKILLQAADLMKHAPGCHVYAVSLDEATPDAVWITEVWTDQAAHDASLGLPGVRELIAQAMPLLAAPPQKGQTLKVLGGAGLPY